MEIWQTKDDLSRLLTTRWQDINNIYFGGELDIKGRMTREQLLSFLQYAFILHEKEFYGGQEAIWYCDDIGSPSQHFDILNGLNCNRYADYTRPFILNDLTVSTRMSVVYGKCYNSRRIEIGYTAYVKYGNLQVLDTLYHEMAHLAGYWPHDKAFWQEGKRTGFSKYSSTKDLLSQSLPDSMLVKM